MQRQTSFTSGKAFQYPAGQLGHLTEDQQRAFDQFRQLLRDRKVYTPRSEGKRPSHDDTLLLRFLRARKFDPEAAITQFTETEQWRRNLAIEEVYDAIDINEYEETRRLYPMWVGRRDKRGFPVYVFEVGSLDPAKVAATDHAESLKDIQAKTPHSTPGRVLRLLALYEHLTQFVSPWCTAVPSRPYAKSAPITQGCNIIDVSGLGFRKAYSLKRHLQDSSQTSTEHYPETLDRIFIVGAPSFFPTLWQWIKRWLDPIVASKIFILSTSEVFSTLSQHIDPQDIPKKYGGQLEWKWGELPNYDPEMLKLISPAQTELKLPIGPTKWVEGEDGEMVLLATGSENGQERRKELLKLDTIWEDVAFFTAPSKRSPSEDTITEKETRPVSNGVVTEKKADPIPNGSSLATAPTAPGPPVS